MTPNTPKFPTPSQDQIKLGLKVAAVVVTVLAAGFGGSHGFDVSAAFVALGKALIGTP